MPSASPKRCEHTGAWIMRAIGCSTAACGKTTVASARAMAHKIWRSGAIGRCICCDENRAINEASKRDASGRGGIETLSCRCEQGKPNARTLPGVERRLCCRVRRCWANRITCCYEQRRATAWYWDASAGRCSHGTRLSPCRQSGPDRILAIPVMRRRSDPCKDTISPLAHVEQLDDRARVPLGQHIDKAAAATDTPRMAHGIAHREQPCEIGLELPRPIAEVLQALVPSLEKIPVERGGVIALLDQLDL